MNQIAQRLFQQVMDVWILPEINERKHKNRIPDNFNLTCAQIIFSLDRGWTKVRLNKEVKAVAEVKTKVPKNKGELIYEHELDEIKSIKLTDDDQNSAHITLMLFRNKWIISFDFRYNKRRIVNHIEAAKEFFESAKDNLSKNRLRPFFENSFACAELAAKAILLQLPDKTILHGKDHDSRIKKFRNWADLGNVKPDYSTTLCKLNNLRSSARYLCSTEYKKEETSKIVETLEEMIRFAESVAHKHNYQHELTHQPDQKMPFLYECRLFSRLNIRT